MANPNDTTYPQGRLPVIFMGDINYGDSTAKTLFTLPANCVIVDGRISGYFTSASNAQSQPALSVGIAPASGGTGNEYLKNWSLGPAQGSNFQGNIPWTRFGAQSSNTWTAGSANAWTPGSNTFQVSGQVSNSPGAGSGPWTVIFEVVDVGQ